MRIKGEGSISKEDSKENIEMCLSCPWGDCVNCLDNRWGVTPEDTIRIQNKLKEKTA